MSTVTLNCDNVNEFNYPDGGSWTNSGGQNHEPNSTAKFFVIPTPVSTTNHRLTITTASEQNPGYYHDCIVRMPNATDGGSNWDGYDMYTSESGNWGLIRGNNGVPSADLASGSMGDLGTFITMVLEADGTGSTVTLNGSINGTPTATNTLDTSGSRVTSGNYGSGAGFGAVHVDSAVLTDTGSTPTFVPPSVHVFGQAMQRAGRW